MAETNTLNTRILLRSDIASNWTSANPVLLKGEIGIEFNAASNPASPPKFKIGDGVKTWSALNYVADFDAVIAQLQADITRLDGADTVTGSVAQKIKSAIDALADVYQTKLPDGNVNTYLHRNATTGALEWVAVDTSVSWGEIQGDLEDQEDLIAALNAKQDLIDAAHKLSSDLVDDTNKTHKFVTSEQIININAIPNKADQSYVDTELDKKVDAIEGYSLVDDELIEKLVDLPADAEANIIEEIQLNGVKITPVDKVVNLNGVATSTDLSALAGRVTTIEGKEAGWDDKAEVSYVDAGDEATLAEAKAYTDEQIGAAIKIKFNIVTELPDPSESVSFNKTRTVYLKKVAETGSDVYEEFICIKPEGTSTYIWEKIGDTHIDLSNYYTKAQVDDLLDDKQDIVLEGENIEIADDGVTISAIEDENRVKLAEDLYTYTNIGKITGASQTNPVKVASEGESLKDVFNKILGTEVDVDPTITDNSKNTMSESGTGAKGAAEHGATFAAANPTVTFTVANGGVAQYGLKTASYETYNKKGANTAFVYPIKTLQTSGQSYNIRVEVPSAYHSLISVTAGTEVARSGNYIYCMLDNNNKVTLKLALPSGTYTQSAQTLCDSLKAYVEYDAASYQGEVVTAFCTYLNANYTQKLTRAGITSGSSKACTVPKGTLYPYVGYNVSTTAPTSGLAKSTDGACYTNGVDVTVANDGYIWFALPVTKTKIQQYALGSWNDMATTSAGTVTYTLASGGTYTYNMYRTTAQQGAGNTLTVRMN